MEYPKTRKEAKETGNKYYFTGQPCKHGHIDKRTVKGACLTCLKHEWDVSNKTRAEKPKSEAAKTAGRKYYAKNIELVKARANARPKEEINSYKKKHKENNPEYYKALVSVRRRRHRAATPKWVTPEDKLAMRQLYLQAMKLTKLTGTPYVVDHIIPLQGNNVSGLHVLSNLRVITQEENLKKSNKHIAQI